MGGENWFIPPLTLGQLRRLMPKVRQLTEIDATMGEPQIAVLVEIVAAALQRNYPEMTPETVEDLLDLGNAGTVLNAVLTGSGLKRRSSPGEAGAVATPDSSPEVAGNTSTDSSPPPAAIAIP
jgi:hypothetical protein